MNAPTLCQVQNRPAPKALCTAIVDLPYVAVLVKQSLFSVLAHVPPHSRLAVVFSAPNPLLGAECLCEDMSEKRES